MSFERYIYERAVIAITTSLSAAVNLAGYALCGIIMPTAWTAANLTFQASHDNTTYNNVYTSNGIEKTVVAAVSEFITIDPIDFIGVEWLKVRSGTSGTPVNQAAAATLILVLRPA